MSQRKFFIFLGMILISSILQTQTAAAVDLSELMGKSAGGATVKELFLARTPANRPIFDTVHFEDTFCTGPHEIRMIIKFESAEERHGDPRRKQLTTKTSKLKKPSHIEAIDVSRRQETHLLPMDSTLEDLIGEFEKIFETQLPPELREQIHPSDNAVELAVFDSLPSCIQEELIKLRQIEATKLYATKLEATNREIARDKAIYSLVTSKEYELTHEFSSAFGTLAITLESKKLVTDPPAEISPEETEESAVKGKKRPFPQTWQEAKSEVITHVNDYLAHAIEIINNTGHSNMMTM